MSSLFDRAKFRAGKTALEADKQRRIAAIQVNLRSLRGDFQNGLGHVGQVASCAVLASFGLSGRTAGVHKKEWFFGQHFFRFNTLTIIILKDIIDKIVPAFNHGSL